MKRIIWTTIAACTLALAPILTASAMPGAHRGERIGTDTAIMRIHGGHYHGDRGHHYGWGRGHHEGWGRHHRH
jgi:hypothetical protein